MLFMRLIIVASAAFAFSAAANTPPVPPPEPKRLAAAQQLVAAFPLEQAFETFDAQGITNEVADSARTWLASQLPLDRAEAVRQIFYEKIKIESRNRLTAAIGDARISLAEDFAHRLSEQDMKGAQTFAVTPEGKAFLRVVLAGNIGIRNLVSRFLYDRMSADFVGILQSARESGKILERVNQKR